jgi:CheY-like chemotaxis protein
MAKVTRRQAMILIVDDDADVRETLCEVLQDEGYSVATARNGLEALDALRQAEHVCLVLLDLMMPVMSGHEFLQRQNAEPKLAGIPVVVMSAVWDDDGGTIAAFLRKPIPLQALLSCAEQYCMEERRAAST